MEGRELVVCTHADSTRLWPPFPFPGSLCLVCKAAVHLNPREHVLGTTPEQCHSLAVLGDPIPPSAPSQLTSLSHLRPHLPHQGSRGCLGPRVRDGQFSPVSVTCLDPHTTKSWERGQVLCANGETKAQRTVSLAINILLAFRLQVPLSSSSSGSGQRNRGEAEEEGQQAEVRGRFSRGKQGRERKQCSTGLKKSWHACHCVLPGTWQVPLICQNNLSSEPGAAS